MYAPTMSYVLAKLVPPKCRRHGSEPFNPDQRVAPGSIGLLDTEAWEFRYVTDARLDDISGDDIDLVGALDRW